MTEQPKVSDCRSCGAKIRFVKMETGKTMPVDAAPIVIDPRDTKTGSRVVTTIGDDGRGRIRRGMKVEGWAASLAAGDAHEFVSGYESHFATCAQANAWRKKDK